jgi:Protein of unknown function (DUF551)
MSNQETKSEEPRCLQSALNDLLSGFISVADGLPAEDEYILAFNPVTGPFYTYYLPNSKGKEWQMTEWNGIAGTWFPQATHWKPLET